MARQSPADQSNKSDAVTTRMKYVVRGEKAVFSAAERDKSYWPGEEHDVRIHDMRPIADELSFDRNGFVLLRGASAARDLTDPTEVEAVYVPEVIKQIERLTGARKVVAFGAMVRTDDSQADDGRLPAFGAHIDYGDRTVRDFSYDLMPRAEADRRLAGRYMLINVWRPVRPVERTPLALCDASTVFRHDLFESEVRGGLGDSKRRSLFGFNLAYAPGHRWYYVPQMQPDEALFFKLFDSDSERVQFTAHSAFNDPNATADAAPRLSIELRTIAYLSD